MAQATPWHCLSQRLCPPPFPPLLPSPCKDLVAPSGAAVFAQPPLGFRRNTINNSENLKNSHKGEGPGWCLAPWPLAEVPHPHGHRSGTGGSVELALHLVQDPDDNVPQRLGLAVLLNPAEDTR